jgi:hypothetical protein
MNMLCYINKYHNQIFRFKHRLVLNILIVLLIIT